MKDMTALSQYQREFLERIISIPSVGGSPEEGAPYGAQPKRVLQTFLDEARQKGFRTGITGNRAGWAEFGKGDRLIGIICHLDVVPVGDGWESDPFTLTLKTDENGREALYARGIADDKGPACAAFFAMLNMAEENRIPRDYRVRLILGSDEERGCSCIQYYAGHAEIPCFAITPDSVFPVIYCEKGIIQLRISGKNRHGLIAHGGSAVNIVPSFASCDIKGRRIKAVGKAAHASKPELGVNAIELLAKNMEEEGTDLNDHPLMKFVRDFDAESFTGCPVKSDYGDLTYNMGMLDAGENGCELRMDLRIPGDADNEIVIDNLSKKASGYGLETQVTINMPPFLVDKDSPKIRMLTNIWKRHIDKFAGFKEEYRDIHTEPGVVGVGTYARHIPNTIAFGIQAPWQTDQCHRANEHVAVSDYLEWIKITGEYIAEAGSMTANGAVC